VLASLVLASLVLASLVLASLVLASLVLASLVLASLVPPRSRRKVPHGLWRHLRRQLHRLRRG
jgi:hypothetical protein